MANKQPETRLERSATSACGGANARMHSNPKSQIRGPLRKESKIRFVFLGVHSWFPPQNPVKAQSKPGLNPANNRGHSCENPFTLTKIRPKPGQKRGWGVTAQPNKKHENDWKRSQARRPF